MVISIMLEKISNSIANWAISLRDREKPLGKLLEGIYLVVINPVIQSVVHGFVFALFSVFLVVKNKPEGEDHIINKIISFLNNKSISTVFNWHFVAWWLVLYALFILASLLCMSHRDRRHELLETYEKGIQSFIRISAGEYEETKNKLFDIIGNADYVQTISDIKEYNFFYSACNRICDSIYEVLNKAKVNPNATFRVCIYLRSILSDSDTYMLYAFDSLNTKPGRYGQPHCLTEYRSKIKDLEKINEKQLGPFLKKNSIPFHALPFLRDNNRDLIIKIGDEIKELYLDFPDDNPTRLHISIPIQIDDTVFLAIQITSHFEDALGNREDVGAIIRSIYPQYNAILTNYYIRQLLLEVITKQYKA